MYGRVTVLCVMFRNIGDLCLFSEDIQDEEEPVTSRSELQSRNTFVFGEYGSGYGQISLPYDRLLCAQHILDRGLSPTC